MTRSLFHIFLATSLIAACHSTSGDSKPPLQAARTLAYEDGAKLTTDQIGLIKGDTSYKIDEKYEGKGALFHKLNDTGNSAQYFLAVDGKYVQAVMLETFNKTDPDEISREFGMIGELTAFQPSAKVNYSGEYLTLSAKDPFLSGRRQEMEITANFLSGIVEGHSVLGEGEIVQTTFTALWDDDHFEFVLKDDHGQHKGDANFYGPNAEEFFAHYQEPTISGMIYATKE